MLTLPPPRAAAEAQPGGRRRRRTACDISCPSRVEFSRERSSEAGEWREGKGLLAVKTRRMSFCQRETAGSRSGRDDSSRRTAE